LVTAPAIQQASIDFPDRSDLENLVLLPDLREFTRSLVPIAEPEAESF